MRPTAIDKAIAKLEAEKAVLELAIQKLREQAIVKIKQSRNLSSRAQEEYEREVAHAYAAHEDVRL